MYICLLIHIYIYIYTHVRWNQACADEHMHRRVGTPGKIHAHLCAWSVSVPTIGGGHDAVGNPHRAQICQFELFELIVLLTLVNNLYIERFEPTVSQSTVSSPPPPLIPLLRVFSRRIFSKRVWRGAAREHTICV